MKELEERIIKDGEIYPGNILKVDSFINHQIDTELLDHMADEFYSIYKDKAINKILTIEASGIAIGYSVASKFKTPLVFVKKAKSKNIGDDVYISNVHSFTYDKDYQITVSKKYLNENDNILIVDDFLANGAALDGLLDLCKQANAKVVGVGIAIEKCFQDGGKRLRARGIDITSLVMIESMNDNRIKFYKR